MTDLMIPASFKGALSSKFATAPVTDELSSGIQTSFGMIGYKGKVWSIRYRGDEKQLMRDDGDGPRGSIEVVIIKGSQHVSKIFYKQGYVEGSNAAPDCFSNNGVVPEPVSTDKQCDTCALCPHNQWGSRTTPAGKAGKACQDSKRIAVVPLGDLKNEAFGGPMLLRVPAASLQDLAGYGQKMQQMGYPYYAVGTKISFDPAESYPKFTFQGIRPLTDEEADIVLFERDSHTVNRILSENEFAVPAAAPAADDGKPLFEQAPEVGANPNVDQAAEAAAAQAKAEAAAKAKAEAAAKVKAEAAAKAKAAKEAAEKAAAEAAALAAAAEVTSEGNEGETDEERELREQEEEMRRRREAIQAKKAAEKAAAEKAAAATTAAETTASASTPAAEDGARSSFEDDLDAMLSELLPS